jgi:hypothetical protein
MSNFRFLLYILFLTLFSFQVYAVGIGQYGQEKLILFQPGLERNYTFYLYDSKSINVHVEGELAQYATIIDANPNGGQRNVELNLKLPEYLEPGTHTMYISATEVVTNGAMVGGYASVKVPIRVFSLYPGKHPELNYVVVNDLNVGEKGVLGLAITNNGEEAVTSASGKITVYDINNLTVAILTTESKSIGSFESQTVNAILDAALYNLTPGTYRAVGTVTYDGLGLDSIMEGTFMVGSMNLNIVDTTPDIYVNATNKYYITVESDWTADIDNVYATIKMPDGKIARTLNADMIKPGQGRKAAAQLEAYLETEGLSAGTYNLDVTLYYNGHSDTKKVKVNIIEGQAPNVDKPNSAITSTTILIGISILIVMFVVIYFLVIRKGKKNYTSNLNDYEKSSFSDKDIKPPSL